MPENNNKVCQTFSIKLYPEEIERFRTIQNEMDGVGTSRAAFNALMDFFENPKTIKVTDPELVKSNEEMSKQIDILNQEVTDLRKQLENSVNDGNQNAQTAQRLQLELEAAQEKVHSLEDAAKHQEIVRASRPENIFEVEVHPVPYHFLKKMAEYIGKQKKTEITPGYVLVDLFLKDLQNPRSNNLPYVVATSEIEKVLNEYKKTHPEEYENN